MNFKEIGVCLRDKANTLIDYLRDCDLDDIILFIIMLFLLMILSLGVFVIIKVASESDEHGPGFTTHLTCVNIHTNEVLINREEPNGTYFSGQTLLIKSKTKDGKKVWTFTDNNLLCVETEK